MKQQLKVSVIIPVYNVDKFLRQCLDSVLNQTLRDIEIICLNDQSTDQSPMILEEYAKKDKRIIVLNQSNSGAGAARNNGLRIAQGEFLSFLDSDDFFEPDMLEKSYKACVSEQLDFVVFRSDRFNNITREYSLIPWTIRNHLLPSQRPFSYRDVPKDLFRLFNGWAWDKLYRREFVQSHNLQFQEQRTTNDMFFVFAALVKAERISIIEDVLVHQRTNLTSLSTTREKSWDCFYAALQALKHELQAMGIYEEVEQSYINYALHFSLWNLNSISGQAFEKLYNILRDEVFIEFGMNKHTEQYFWSKGEYGQYCRIRDMSISSYLIYRVETLQKEIKKLKDEIQLTNDQDEPFDYYSYKIGRTVTYIPRMIKKSARSLRDNGFKYTMDRIKTKITQKLA